MCIQRNIKKNFNTYMSPACNKTHVCVQPGLTRVSTICNIHDRGHKK